MVSKPRMFAALLVVAALVGAAGCGGGGAQITGAIQGWVYAHANARDGAAGDVNAPDMILLPGGAAARHVPTGYVPLQGARVTVVGTSKYAVTDANGYFYISGLRAGTYTVDIVHERFITGLRVMGVTVVAGQTTTVIDDMALGSFFYLNIGISDYWFIDDLNYCDDDATAMTEALYVNNYFAGQVEQLIDGQATKQGILNGIASIGSEMTDYDVFVMYFSGHGGCVYDPGVDPYDDYVEFICPVDTVSYGNDAVDVGTVITDSELAQWLRAYIPSGAVKVVIFDSCYSGGMARADGMGTPAPAGRWMNAIARNLVGSGYIVLTACADNEVAVEFPAIKHGVFTYYLLEGLTDAACDVNGDGIVTVREAFDYANDRVQAYTDGAQHPQSYWNPDSLKDQAIYRTIP